MVEEQFFKWLINAENKVPASARSYSLAINEVSDHFSQKTSSKNTNLYNIDDAKHINVFVSLYDTQGKFADYGNENNGRRRAAIKAYYRFVNNTPKTKGKRDTITILKRKDIEINNQFPFEASLINEASVMSNYYQLIYCLEQSIRRMVENVMEEAFDKNWWNNKISETIRNKVDLLISEENSRVFSKRSEHKIDYTTFGELRRIVAMNWGVFSKKFKNQRDFDNVTESLNKLRNSIAHSVVLPEDEVARLNLALKDWFRLLK